MHALLHNVTRTGGGEGWLDRKRGGVGWDEGKDTLMYTDLSSLHENSNLIKIGHRMHCIVQLTTGCQVSGWHHIGTCSPLVRLHDRTIVVSNHWHLDGS